MDYIYIIGIIIIVFAALKGYRRGLVSTLGNICASILAIGLLFVLKTWAFESFFTTIFFEHTVFLTRVILCIVIYLLLFFLLKLIVMSLKIITGIPVIKGLNKLLGFVAGAVYGVILVGVISLVYKWFFSGL